MSYFYIWLLTHLGDGTYKPLTQRGRFAAGGNVVCSSVYSLAGAVATLKSAWKVRFSGARQVILACDI